MRILWELPYPSANMDPPWIGMDGADWVLRYREPLTDMQRELRFLNPDYVAFTSADEVTEDQLLAYDQVVELDQSPLPQAVSSERRSDRPPLKHYRIFYDDFGALDAFAEGFVPPDAS